MKLGLGTVQFGLNYGVSNRAGKPSAGEVGRILGVAREAGVAYLDTAAEYGESESVLGSFLGREHSFRVVTKTGKNQPDVPLAENVSHLREVFSRSLERLQLKSVYGLLFHQSSDLLGPAGDVLFAALSELKKNGLVERLGISVYNPEEAIKIAERFPIDLIQAPLSLLDQRFLREGTLAALKKKGIEVHVRSVFLQGLLLMDPDRLNPYFQPIREHLVSLRRSLAERRISIVSAALRFVASLPEVTSVICGTNSVAELTELIQGYGESPLPMDWEDFSLCDELFFNPSLWRLSP